MAFDENRRRKIYDRTDGYCHICHRKLAFKNYGEMGARGAWEVEHARPRSRGGTDHGNNRRGQVTTHTNAEGNVTVYLRHRFDDPDGGSHGSGTVPPELASKQYGWVKETRIDVDPANVASLVGSTGDLGAFTLKISRDSNVQPNSTQYENLSVQVPLCDQLGNALEVVDARGATTTTLRNELGEPYRETSPSPYDYQRETFYDANRNVTRIDVQDIGVQVDSGDYFAIISSGTTANLSPTSGPGGATRSGWFTNTYSFDLLDNLTQEQIDATGSTPAVLTTSYEYDANQNLVLTTRPEGTQLEYDYDERNLRIAQRLGGNTGSSSVTADPSVHVTVFDGNGNAIMSIAPVNRGGSGTGQGITVSDAFGSGSPLNHTGDVTTTAYDGFDRAFETTDAVGNTVEHQYDPAGHVIEMLSRGPVGGASPTNRNGSNNTDLAHAVTRFDEAGRAYEVERMLVGSGQ